MVHPRAAQYLFACIINDIKSEKSKNEDAENSSI
jgi:hypothetical protein